MLRPLAALLLVSPLYAAPAPKARDVKYFPTHVGDKREYEIRVGERVEGGYTDVVSKVEKKDEALHVTITRERQGAESFVTTIALNAEGISRITADGKALAKPAILLKLPAKVGTSWPYDGDGESTYTVAGEDEVQVPAGKFKAVRVELTTLGQDSKLTLWFAAGVGLVKTSYSDNERVQVLKSFTPGK